MFFGCPILPQSKGQMRVPLPHTKYFTIWIKWAATRKVCLIYPNSIIFLPVQFYALCPVLSGVIWRFNTKSFIMPHATQVNSDSFFFSVMISSNINIGSVFALHAFIFPQTFSVLLEYSVKTFGSLKCFISVTCILFILCSYFFVWFLMFSKLSKDSKSYLSLRDKRFKNHV